MNRIPYLAILDEDHNVIAAADILEWGQWFEQTENRTVARTQISGFLVSTVFLGIDHGFGKKQLWFETMVFEDEDRPVPIEVAGTLKKLLADYQVRYSTWIEAEAGHNQIIEVIQKGLF